MPTNLPPECAKLEEQYREAKDLDEKIRLLEELLGCIPKHKGTDHLRADLRRKLSKLQAAAEAGGGRAKTASAYHIDREGAGQVVLVGPPNVGKSALVATLTNSSPEVSPSPFSTWEPTPGMMPVYDVQVQLIDTPPLNPDYVERALYDLIRRADLVLLVVDVQTDPLGQLEESLALLREQRIAPVE
ncbi:MAG: 50S ribosome-binding GTPase, partial [Chloroflexi bacterium]|nr:50S ribosome-binding GTPase [Chloroflexota bacterium]